MTKSGLTAPSQTGDEGAPPIHRTILRQGSTHIVDLAAVDPLIPRGETRVEQGFLDDICAEIERVAALHAHNRIRGIRGIRGIQTGPASKGKDESGLLAELQGLGRLLFSHSLTPYLWVLKTDLLV